MGVGPKFSPKRRAENPLSADNTIASWQRINSFPASVHVLITFAVHTQIRPDSMSGSTLMECVKNVFEKGKKSEGDLKSMQNYLTCKG